MPTSIIMMITSNTRDLLEFYIARNKSRWQEYMSKIDTIHQNKAEVQQLESESAFWRTLGYARFLHSLLSLLKLFCILLGGDQFEVAHYQAFLGAVLCIEVKGNFEFGERWRLTPYTWGMKFWKSTLWGQKSKLSKVYGMGCLSRGIEGICSKSNTVNTR